MSNSKTVWRVRVEDAQYSWQSDTFLLRCTKAADTEPLAIKLYRRRHRLAKGDAPVQPFIRSLECLGDLDN